MLGVVAGYRILRRAPAVWRGRRRNRLGAAVFWRFVLPAAAALGLLAAGLGLILHQPAALYWLVTVIIGLLMSAARSSWDLLVTVAEERRTTASVGLTGSRGNKAEATWKRGSGDRFWADNKYYEI